MAKTTRLISIERLKEISLINDNVDAKVIAPHILQCQDIYIQPLLGTALYNDLKTQIETDNTLSTKPLYKTLLDDYIHLCLTWYIECEILSSNTYKIANKAVLTKSSDNSQPASLSEIFSLRDDMKNKAEWYAQRLAEYLSANSDDYPLYLQSQDLDGIYPKPTAYSTGIYLGGGGNDCKDRWYKRR